MQALPVQAVHVGALEDAAQRVEDETRMTSSERAAGTEEALRRLIVAYNRAMDGGDAALGLKITHAYIRGSLAHVRHVAAVAGEQLRREVGRRRAEREASEQRTG